MLWRFRSRTPRDPDDFADEVRAHIELEAARLRDEGLSPDEARRRATRAFGNPTRQIERTYDASRWRWLDTLRQDARYALRLIRRSPGFTATAVLVLALGIGINAALFSIINAVFFRTLPVIDQDSLRFVYVRLVRYPNYSGIGADAVEAVRARTDLFGTVVATNGGFSRKVRIAGRTSYRTAESVSSNYFDVADVRPMLGRVLLPEDERPDAAPVVLISERVWRSEFHGDPSVLGAAIDVDLSRYSGYFGPWRQHRIVGVLPADFAGLGSVWQATDYWEPRRVYVDDPTRPPDQPLPRPVAMYLIGRVSPSVSDAHLEAALGAIAFPLQRDPANPDWAFEVRRSDRQRLPFVTRVVPEQLAGGFMIIAGLVLLVATTNLAGVLAARGASRRTEVAVRLALGAGRGRVVRQLLTESTVLALLGGALAIVVAQILVAVFLASTPSGFGRGDVSLRVPLDLRVLGFTALVCLGSGLAVGLLPARRATRRTLLPGLASAHGTEGPSARGGRKYWIVVPQLSASLVLLLVAGALVQALLRAQARDPGFDPEHVAMVAIEAPSGIVRAEDRRQTLVDLERRVLDRAHAVPGVESAAVVDGTAWGLPLSLFRAWVIGRDAFNDRAYRWVTRNDVSSEYFDTLRIPLHAGRLFDERDTPDTVPVAIVSESAARLIWPGRQAVGQYLALHSADNPRPPSWLEVVGVVGDVALPDGDGWNPATYTPRRQGTPGMGGGVLLARGAGPVGDLVRNIREVVESADGTMQVMNARPLVEAVDAALYPRRMAAGMLSSAGLVSLLLAAIGLYGVVSYSVAQRLREMGIRAALGADRLDIIWLILRDGIRILLLGCLAGGALTYGALRTASALVIPLPGFDAVILTAVPAILAIVVIASCAIPAWRASRVDPNVALREL